MNRAVHMLLQDGHVLEQFVNTEQPPVLPRLKLPDSATPEDDDMARVPAIPFAGVAHAPVCGLSGNAAAIEHPSAMKIENRS